MLAELPAVWPETVEELASANGPGNAGPGGPEVLHPAQRTTVQEDSGLTGFQENKINTRQAHNQIFRQQEDNFMQGKVLALTFATTPVKFHGVRKIEVFRAEGPVGVVRLS